MVVVRPPDLKLHTRRLMRKRAMFACRAKQPLTVTELDAKYVDHMWEGRNKILPHTNKRREDAWRRRYNAVMDR